MNSSISFTKKFKNLCSFLFLIIPLTTIIVTCSVEPGEGPGSSGNNQKYLELKIDYPPDSKLINVSEFSVTGLRVVVTDPGGTIARIINWTPDDGSRTYRIPARQLGEYALLVRHTGVENGEIISVEESDAFNIQAGIITVINIIPGAVGVINILNSSGPERASAPYGVTLEIQNEPTAEPLPGDDVQFLAGNDSNDTLYITPVIVNVGLDQRTARRQLPNVILARGARVLLTVSMRDMPIQSVGSATQGALEIRIRRTPDSSSFISVLSRSFFFDFDMSYEQPVAYDLNGLEERFYQNTDAQLITLQGRVLNATGGYTDISVLQRNEGRLLRAGGTRVLSAHSFGPEIFQPEPVSGIRIRGLWRAHYIDAGFGEDYLLPAGGDSLQHVPASFALAKVKRHSDQSIVWLGNLDRFGNTPVLSLASGGYSLFITTILETPTGQKFTVNKRSLNPDFPKGPLTLEAGLYVLPDIPPGIQSVDLIPGYIGPISNVSAVVSHLLTVTDHGIVPGDYIIHGDTSCPGIPGNSCCSWGEVYIGVGGGIEDNEWKYVIAHEIGHQIQQTAVGYLLPDYDATTDNEHILCNCSHVSVANSYHCLQSLEHVTAAHVEGFAQFYAAKAFNDMSQPDCMFVYYKEFRELNNNVTPPPVPLDAYNPVKWRNNNCAHILETGTEYDWLGFLMKLHRDLPMADIYNIYNSYNMGNWVLYEELRFGAETYFGISHPSYINFINSAEEYGVDNQFQ